MPSWASHPWKGLLLVLNGRIVVVRSKSSTANTSSSGAGCPSVATSACLRLEVFLAYHTLLCSEGIPCWAQALSMTCPWADLYTRFSLQRVGQSPGDCLVPVQWVGRGGASLQAGAS